MPCLLEFASFHWALVAGGLKSKSQYPLLLVREACPSPWSGGTGRLLSTTGQPGAVGCRAAV